MLPAVTMSIDVDLLAEALGIDVIKATGMLYHSATLARFMTEKIMTELNMTPGYELAANILKDKDNNRYAVRVLGRNVSFTPSSMQGVGRVFDEIKAKKFIADMTAFFVIDLVSPRKIDVYVVTSTAVLKHMADGRMDHGLISKNHFHDWMQGKVKGLNS